ncbi:hypothetical protein G7Y89_g1956 [Cudoniella acicularis]|uniref:Uncharacterized protein n=1 Tax=Cudoniella acicularis TaxID=354080 RepID=A0A8H4W6I7_9HELO|nr:hypothetical protein G7Y89_g1956 [Cudoniella acicularis]
MSPPSYSWLLFLFVTARISTGSPLALPSQLADCLYNNNHNFTQSSNLISTAEIEACTGQYATRDLERINPGPGYSPDEIIAKRGTQATPLIVPGEEVAAKVTKRGLETRTPPPVGFFDQSSDTPNEPWILSNFLETGILDTKWSTPICNEVTKFDPHQTGQSGAFNYNIQGTHKQSLSLVHDKRYLHLLVTFSGVDVTLLPQYDLVDLCKNAMHQAAQSYHELKYGFFGTQTVYSVVNNHRIVIQPTETPGQSSKRSDFGAPIGLINIQIGDQAKDVTLFNANGLPGV